jgi:hypothetical protein
MGVYYEVCQGRQLISLTSYDLDTLLELVSNIWSLCNLHAVNETMFTLRFNLQLELI